jgi:hypothetical protein
VISIHRSLLPASSLATLPAGRQRRPTAAFNKRMAGKLPAIGDATTQ